MQVGIPGWSESRSPGKHQRQLRPPDPWEAATPGTGQQQQGFPPGKVHVAPAVALSPRRMLVEVSVAQWPCGPCRAAVPRRTGLGSGTGGGRGVGGRRARSSGLCSHRRHSWLGKGDRAFALLWTFCRWRVSAGEHGCVSRERKMPRVWGICLARLAGFGMC